MYFSYDRGGHWQHLQNLPLDQFYAVGCGHAQALSRLRRPSRQRQLGRPSRTYSVEGNTVADWFRIYGADGFYCQPDPNDADTVYCEGQYGNLHARQCAAPA